MTIKTRRNKAFPGDRTVAVLVDGQCVCNLTRYQNRFGQCYESDTWTGQWSTIAAFKSWMKARQES